MGAIHIDKRRQEFLDRDNWTFECEDHADLPTEGVPVLSTAWELPTNKMYYFSSAGTWLECGAGGSSAASGGE